jgi:hypothetical protein
MSHVGELLQSVVDRPSAVAWFRGLFVRVHLEVTDTLEQFTVVHHGDHGEVLAGLEGEAPNFVLRVPADAIERLAAAFQDDTVGPDEEYRIVRFMLRPCLEAALKMPIVNHQAMRAILKMDDVWQEALLDPDGRQTEPLTAIHEHGHWRVVEGFTGDARRRLIMRPDQALDFQRRLFAANDHGSLKTWLELATWYVGWREAVTVPVR